MILNKFYYYDFSIGPIVLAVEWGAGDPLWPPLQFEIYQFQAICPSTPKKFPYLVVSAFSRLLDFVYILLYKPAADKCATCTRFCVVISMNTTGDTRSVQNLSPFHVESTINHEIRWQFIVFVVFAT